MPTRKYARDFREDELIGKLLAEKRRAAGLTQRGLASLLGRPQSFVSNVELGQHRVGLVELLDLGAALAFDPSRFVRTLGEALRKRQR